MMHEELYKLKEKLMEELKEYGNAGELSAGSLEVVDKLAHAIKNLCKIIDAYEEEDYSGNYMYEGGNRGGSYARMRDSRGRYTSRGYSREGTKSDMLMQLREMMRNAPDEHIRMRIQELMQEFER